MENEPRKERWPSKDAARRVVERARLDLVSLAGRRVLVTGATGFFGRWMLEVLTDVFPGPSEIVALSRRATEFSSTFGEATNGARLSFVDLDVRKLDELAFEAEDIFHFATSADASLNEKEPLEMFGVVFDGTRSVLDYARRVRAERLLFSSSGAVYGSIPPEILRVSETFGGAPDSLDARSSYHVAKRAAEHLCALASTSGGPLCKIARCFAFSGVGLPLERHFAFGNFVHDAANGREIRVASDGRALRSYLDSEDLVVWLLAILARGQTARAYNVGSEEVVSVAELAARVARLGNVSFRIEGTPDSRPAHRYVPDTMRARSELGLKQEVGLDESIGRALTWARTFLGKKP